jgi:hypothetical protein
MPLSINDQSITTLSDFITKLYAFLTTGGAGNPGWTADRLAAGSGEMAVSKDDGAGEAVEVAFQWDTGSPNALGIYQYHSALGAGNYVPGSLPYGQIGDSGNGAASTSDSVLDNLRNVLLTSSPLQYWCFTGDTWAYVVVQTSSTSYVHFGFGVLDKFNDWAGGAFAYGQRTQGSFSSDTAVREGSTNLLDGLCKNGAVAPNPGSNQEFQVATVRCDSLPGQIAGGLWAVVMGTESSLGDDRQAAPKARTLFVGGYRGGELARESGVLLPSPVTGFVPGYPIAVTYWDRINDQTYGPMGIMPGVRGISWSQFEAGDEIVIGSDTWVVFPSRRKDNGTTPGGSGNQGIMYLKN